MKSTNAFSLKERGFTVVELVVVIVVIGVLAAVALPRFLGLQDRAHDAVVEGTQSALASGVIMAKSVWLAEGRDSPLDNVITKSVETCVAATTASPACAAAADKGLETNGSGYPTGHTQDDDTVQGADTANQISSNADCVEVFEFLLSESSVKAADKANLSGTDADEAFEFAASNDATTTTTCLYEYLPDIADRFSPASTYRTISYDSLTGRVTVSNLSSTGQTSL